MIDRIEWYTQEEYSVHRALWALAEDRGNITVLKLNRLWLIVASNDHGVRQDGDSFRRVPLPTTTSTLDSRTQEVTQRSILSEHHTL